MAAPGTPRSPRRRPRHRGAPPGPPARMHGTAVAVAACHEAPGPSWHEPAEAETAAAVAELHEILAGRDNGPVLLVEVAGLMIGYHEGGVDEPRARAAAHYLTEARADPDVIGLWAEEGRRRNRWP